MLKKQNAFTLIELLVTVVIMAVVAVIAVPNFNSMINSSRSSGLSGDIVAVLNYARGEAVKRGTRVSICPSSDGAKCLTSADWAKGWLVFVDAEKYDTAAAASIDKPLKHWNDINPNAVISAVAGTTAISFLRFTSSGVLGYTGVSDAKSRIFKVSIKNCKGDAASETTVGLAGLISSVKVACP